MRITEYTSASRHFNECIDVSTQKRRKRCKFHYTIMQTFDALRMHPNPQFRRFLDNRDVRVTIAGEARKWIKTSYYRGRMCVNDRCAWFKQFAELQIEEQNPIGETWECEVQLIYMLDNISCGNIFVEDVMDTLHSIRNIQYTKKFAMLRAVCTPDNDEVERHVRQTASTREQYSYWLTTYAAPCIARNAFELGWELRMLSIVYDFAVEVVMRKPRNYGLMHTFLFCIETKIIQAQEEEEVSFNFISVLYCVQCLVP
jgi:hypothetical protein